MILRTLSPTRPAAQVSFAGRVCRSFLGLAPLCAMVVLSALCSPHAWAQDTGGSVSVTVTDQQGALIPAAHLELRDLNSNEVRKAATLDGGSFRYVGLSVGSYSLMVSKEGFSNTIVKPIDVQAARVTDVAAVLQLGQVTQTVEVNGGAVAVLETSSNMIGTTIDLKQIEDLPIGGRDITQLSFQAPGYNGTWN